MLLRGATPVLVDLDPVTWNLDPRALSRALIALALPSCALAIDVSEATVNQLLAAKLAEKKYADLGLSASHLALLDGYARFCAAAKPRVYPRQLHFCADLTPQWRQDTATLSASRMSLVSLEVAGVDAK